MGRCWSLGEILPVVTAIITALYKKCFKRRLDLEGLPQSFNFDGIENPPEINQKSTFLTTMNDEIKYASASLDNLKQSINECQHFQEAWSSVLRCFREEKFIPCSKYPETVVALKEYRKTAGNLFDKIDAVEMQEQEIIDNMKTVASTLAKKKTKIDEELNSYKEWTKYLKTIYYIVLMVILVIAAALLAVTLPWAAIAGVIATIMKESTSYFDSLWDNQKLNLESNKKEIKKVSRPYSAVMDDMVTIRLQVSKVKIRIGSVKEKVESLVKEGEGAVELRVVETIETEMKDVMKEMNDLQENVKLCKCRAQKANREFSMIISEEIPA